MAKNKKCIVRTPRGKVIQTKTKGGIVKCELKWKEGFGQEKTKDLYNVQDFIDSEVLRLCDPLTPMRSKALILSGKLMTEIGSGQVRYKTPYAKRWYYEPANFNGAPQRGNKWFERMKTMYKDDILRGAKQYAKAK